MPNSSDTYVLDVIYSLACQLTIASDDKITEVGANENYVINFTSDPGANPKAPGIAFLFAWYDTATHAASAKALFDALDNDGTEGTVLAANQLAGADLPSAVISPENVPTTAGITGCIVSGAAPDIEEDEDYHALVGMRQAALTT